MDDLLSKTDTSETVFVAIWMNGIAVPLRHI